MKKNRVDLNGLYHWVLEEFENAKQREMILYNVSDNITIPPDFFNYNNDKVFSSGVYVYFDLDEQGIPYIRFGADPEWADISCIKAADKYNLDAIFDPLFYLLDFIFERDHLLENYQRYLMTDNKEYDILLNNIHLFSKKEETSLINKKYTREDFRKDFAKIKFNTTEKLVNKNTITTDYKDLVSKKRSELISLFRHPENTAYPERDELEISKFLIFDIDLDKLKKGDQFQFNDVDYIVDSVKISDVKPQKGNITEYGIEIEEVSLPGSIKLFKAQDNTNYTFDFYKTNRVKNKHSIFFCCSLYEDQDYIYDITRFIPDDRELVQLEDILVSDRAYNAEDFEYLRGVPISVGESIAEQTERAFIKEFLKKSDKLNDNFDVREWSTQYILKNFDLDLSNSFNYEVQPVIKTVKKMKM